MQFKYVLVFVGLAVVSGTAYYFWKQVSDKTQVLLATQKAVTSDAKTNRNISIIGA